MKTFYIILGLSLILLQSCGGTQTTVPAAPVAASGSQQALPTSTPAPTCTGMTATINVPPAGMMGGSQSITYNGHQYFMSPSSNQTCKNFVWAVPAGQTLPICFTGTFTRQNGIPPFNPTVYFDVIVLTSISFI